MIKECKDYLVQRLKGAGVKTKIKTTLKELKITQDSHIGAVLYQKEKFKKVSSKKVYKDETGKKKRIKIFDREVYFSVVIGEYQPEKCEEIFEQFVKTLEEGIIVDGNYVPLEVVEADWVDKDDSILNSRIAVEVLIKFDGGIYKDYEYKEIKEVGIEIEVGE